jgi:hypothetical protein
LADQLFPVRPLMTDGLGLPLAGGTVLFVRTGTALPVSLFTDPGLGTLAPNPVVIDAAGLLPPVWFADSFAVDAVLRDADGAYAGTLTNIPRWSNATSAASGISIVPVDGIDGTDVQTAIETLAEAMVAQQEATPDEQREALGLGSAAERNLSANADFTVDGNLVPTRASVVAYHDAHTALTQVVTVTGIPIASATSQTVSHGFGDKPRSVEGWLVCTADDAGYTAGDSIAAPWNSSGAATARLTSVQRRNADVVVRFSDAASVFAARHQTTGALTALTNASWTLTLVIMR